MSHSYTRLLSHVIFGTKGRKPWIDVALKDRLYPYMRGIVHELGGETAAINGTMDHVHMLILLPPTQSLADAMRVLKTNSSRWIHETWPDKKSFGWQTGYGAFSVSQSCVCDVRLYIENQEEHHSKTTFQEEYIAFLERHGISYDDRYIWG